MTYAKKIKGGDRLLLETFVKPARIKKCMVNSVIFCSTSKYHVITYFKTKEIFYVKLYFMSKIILAILSETRKPNQNEP